MDDDCQIQADSLNDVLSVEAWAAENRHETCCARLNNFDWVVPPYDLAILPRILPRPELNEESSDVERDIYDVRDEFSVGIDKTAVEPLCLPVVVQTRPQVGCDPDLPLPVDKGKESLVEDGPDIIFSGRKLNVKISDVSRGICVVPDQFPVVVPKKAVEPLVLPVVVMTRSQADCASALTLPVDEEKNSQVEEGPDMLSGRVMDMGDLDVERSNQVLLEVVPFVDGDVCPMRWLETEFDDSVMEKFVLVPDMSLIGSMKSAVVPTFLPALSLQRECLSSRMLEVNFRRFMLGTAPWLWSV